MKSSEATENDSNAPGNFLNKAKVVFLFQFYEVLKEKIEWI